MWWECGSILKFSQLVFKEINLEGYPKTALLSIFDNIDNSATKELISSLLTAARLIVARNWKMKYDLQLNDIERLGIYLLIIS